MKFLIRAFFRTLRRVLGPVMLFKEWATRPKGLSRPAAAQAAVDQQCESLALYQYQTCPFCIKVRQEMARLSLNIERRDAQAEGPVRQALREGGGQTQVPCLRITDASGASQWLYDSAAILTYLRGRFSA